MGIQRRTITDKGGDDKEMGKLIDADKLKAHYSWWKDGTREMTMGEAKDIFDEIVDMQPTAGKQGRWYDVSNYLGTGKAMYVCSECAAGSSREDPYCWHCGARMDGGKDDADK